MYVCMYVCMYVYIYTYIYICIYHQHIYIYDWLWLITMQSLRVFSSSLGRLSGSSGLRVPSFTALAGWAGALRMWTRFPGRFRV